MPSNHGHPFKSAYRHRRERRRQLEQRVHESEVGHMHLTSLGVLAQVLGGLMGDTSNKCTF